MIGEGDPFFLALLSVGYEIRDERFGEIWISFSELRVEM